MNLMLVYTCPVHGIILQDQTDTFEGNEYCKCSRLAQPLIDEFTNMQIIKEVPEARLFNEMGIDYNIENEIQINE